MQHSFLSAVLLPVDTSQQLVAVPFLPSFASAKTSANFGQLNKQKFANFNSNIRRVLSNRLFRHKALGLLSLFIPTSFVLSMAIFLPASPLYQGKMASDMASLSYQAVHPTTPSLDAIVAKKTLTIATTQGESTYFGSDGFEHGFGHDVMNGYANHLGVTLKTLVVANEQQALQAVNQGQADMLLTALPSAANEPTLATLSVTCQQDFASQHGLSRDTAVVVANADSRLVASMQHYLCDTQVLRIHEQLAAFYTTQVFDSTYSQNKFTKTLATKLPNYQTTFKQSAKQHHLDWQLLVAMGYQESQLDSNAVSPTGVRGIMMLTNDAAEQVGIADRIDPIQSIQGGAKLFNTINEQFNDIPASDRLWFTLAGYNMGPQAVRKIQDKLRQEGRNADSWAEVYAYLARHRGENRRYVQCMQYVTHIRGYLEALKLGTTYQSTTQKVA